MRHFVEASFAAVVCAASAAVSIAGLAGWRNGRLDVINSFAPFTLLSALGGGVMAWASLAPGPARAGLVALALFAGLCNLAFTVPELVRRRLPEEGEGAPFRVLSANVWADNPSPDLAISHILACDPDVLFLQESDGSLAPGLERLKTRYPYASEFPRAGEQIFVKTPILRQGWKLGLGIRHVVWIETLLPDGRPMILITVHFPQPTPPGPQQAIRVALGRLVGSLPSANMILAGDFNTTPWSFAMRRQDEMLRPLNRRTITLFSWPARLANLGRDWPIPVLPIDHIYAGPAWGPARLTRIRIPGSDHFAIEAVFWLRAPTAAQHPS